MLMFLIIAVHAAANAGDQCRAEVNYAAFQTQLDLCKTAKLQLQHATQHHALVEVAGIALDTQIGIIRLVLMRMPVPTPKPEVRDTVAHTRVRQCTRQYHSSDELDADAKTFADCVIEQALGPRTMLEFVNDAATQSIGCEWE